METLDNNSHNRCHHLRAASRAGALGVFDARSARVAADGRRGYVDADVCLTFYEVPSFAERRRIDTNRDGRISDAELQAYRWRLFRTLSQQFALRVDGQPQPLAMLAPPKVDLWKMRRVTEHRLSVAFRLTAVVDGSDKPRHVEFVDLSASESPSFGEMMVSCVEGASIDRQWSPDHAETPDRRSPKTGDLRSVPVSPKTGDLRSVPVSPKTGDLRSVPVSRSGDLDTSEDTPWRAPRDVRAVRFSFVAQEAQPPAERPRVRAASRLASTTYAACQAAVGVLLESWAGMSADVREALMPPMRQLASAVQQMQRMEQAGSAGTERYENARCKKGKC